MQKPITFRPCRNQRGTQIALHAVFRPQVSHLPSSIVTRATNNNGKKQIEILQFMVSSSSGFQYESKTLLKSEVTANI